MKIVGIEGMTVDQVTDEVRRGGRFVIFSYCISALVVTFKRGSDVHFIRAGGSPLGASMPFTLLSLFLGWWGFPFGLIYTPICIITNLSGGKDVTAEMMNVFRAPAQAPASLPSRPGDLPPSSFGG
jgi:hypothetical protein